MGTLIDASSDETSSHLRQIVRLSNGDLVAGFLNPGTDEVELYVSQDGGSTWSNEATATADTGTVSSDGVTVPLTFGLAVDSFDQLHVSSRDPADTAQVIYNKFSANISATFDPTTQDAAPIGVAWNGDGTKLFVAGDTNDSVFEYTVSTAYDLSSTVSSAASADVSTQTTAVSDVAWNGDGSKMYVVGRSNADIYEYTVSTAYDLSSTVSHVATHSTTNEDTDPRGMAWNGDGSKLFVAGRGTSTIYEYSVSTAYDLSSTVALQSSEDVSAQSSQPVDMEWNGDGTKLFVLTGENLTSYTVSTGYDLSSTVSSDTTFTFVEDTLEASIVWGDTGSKLFYVGTQNDLVYQYPTSTAYDLGTIGGTGSLFQLVTDEAAFSGNNSTVGESSMVVDSNDTPYIAHGFVDKVMGTNYFHLRLVERVSGTWNDRGAFQTGETDNINISAAATSADDIALAFQQVSTTTLYQEWDTSEGDWRFTSGGSSAPETVESSAGKDGALMVDSSDVPIISIDDDIWKRTSGTWSSDQFTTDAVDNSTLTFGGTDIYVVYDSGGDIKENHAAFGSFATGDATTVESSANNLNGPSSRWQLNNENDPSPDVVDFIYFDETNGDGYYSSISTGAGAQTATAVAATTTSSALDPTATPGAVTASAATGTGTATALDPTISATTTATGAVATATTTSLAASATPGTVATTPAIASMVASAQDPTASPGAVSVTGAVGSTTASALDPAVAVSTTVTPAVASAIASAPDPTATPGAVTATAATGSTAAASLDPTASPGLVSAAAAAGSTTASAISPTASPGAVTPTAVIAAVVSSAQDPAATPGTATASADTGTSDSNALAATATPGATTATADTGSATASATTASAVIASVVSAAVATAASSALDPAATPGAVSTTPAIASLSADAISPTTSAVATVAAALASTTASATTPTVSPGVASAAADTSSATTTAIDATASPGLVSASVPVAAVTTSALDPAASTGGLVSADTASITTTATTPTATPGGVTTAADTGAVQAAARDPSISPGAVTAAAATGATAASALDPAATPGATSAAAATGTATVTAPSVTATPGTVSALADVGSVTASATVVTASAASLAELLPEATGVWEVQQTTATGTFRTTLGSTTGTFSTTLDTADGRYTITIDSATGTFRVTLTTATGVIRD